MLFLSHFLKNMQNLDAYKPFIYKDFAKGFTKSVSSIELDYYSFSSLPCFKSTKLYHTFFEKEKVDKNPLYKL